MSCKIFKEDKNYIITSSYGPRIHPVTGKQHFHTGIDVVSDGKETTIVALEAGIIVDMQTSVKGYDEEYSKGNYVRIKHASGRHSMYLHLAYGSIPSSFKIGTTINKGQKLGIMGNTGMSTGTHCHFQVYDRDGSTIIESSQYLLTTNINEDGDIMYVKIKPCTYAEKSDNVKHLQQRLSQLNDFYKSEIERHSWNAYTGFDGIYGKGLDKTVKTIRYELGLSNGGCDEEFCEAINAMYDSLKIYNYIKHIIKEAD